MIQLEEISKAHAKVKSGADFPNYVQDLIAMGVKKYEVFVKDGKTFYYDNNDKELKSKRKYANLTVANISDKDRFKHHLKNHQRGQTDYLTFCQHCAETGVEKWLLDFETMTCSYYDKNGAMMWEEKIPVPQVSKTD